MRTAFVKALLACAEADPRVTLVVGDLGFGVVTPFRDKLPRQFVNAGVAEQNMTGLAAGLALSGKIAFTYSIANFPVVRCLEQIRNDVCYHNANVKVVAVGGGYAYGSLGASHHATEDLALMRAMPNMVVVAPGDPYEAAEATKALVAHPGPGYLRIGRDGEPRVHGADAAPFCLGEALTVREGSDLTLISTGASLVDTVAAADSLRERGIRARVLSMHTVKPLDTAAVLAAARDTGILVTVEEHSLVGGLGSAVAEALMDAGVSNVHLKRVALPDGFSKVVGDQRFLRAVHGVDAGGVVEAVESVLGTALVPALR